MPTKSRANRSSRKERRIARLEAHRAQIDQQHTRQLQRMQLIFGRRAHASTKEA